MSKHKHPIAVTPVLRMTRQQLLDLCQALGLPVLHGHPTKAVLSILSRAGVAYIENNPQRLALTPQYLPWTAQPAVAADNAQDQVR